jgi:L-threonylcarbamoyladenylate synthase
MEERGRPRCLTVDPRCPEPRLIQDAALVLQGGGVVAYPTDTVYGLAVDAMNAAAVARLYAVKQRPAEKALPLIIGDLGQLAQVVVSLPVSAERLIAAFWPGPLTLVMVPHACVPTPVLGASGRVGVRWPAAAVSQQLALALGRAITASSANRSGAVAALTAAEVVTQLDAAVDLLLDGGTMPSAQVSTVLDVTVDPPALLRAGKIPSQTIEAVLGCRLRTVLTPG